MPAKKNGISSAKIHLQRHLSSQNDECRACDQMRKKPNMIE